MSKNFTSKPVAKRDPIPFTLDGEEFVFQPVKVSGPIVAMMTIKGKDQEAEMERAGSMLDWLASGLDPEYYKAHRKNPDLQPDPDSQWTKLLDMLQDPDPDSLALDTVLDVIAWLMGELSGNPTT